MYLPGLLSSSSPLFLLSTVLFNFPAFELLCLFSCVSFFLWNNKKAKKFGAWRWVGSFLHSSLHTLQVCGFSYSNSWNVVLLFFCCQLLDLICRVVGFSFFFISGSVLWFTLAADQSKSGQCGHIDEELQVLGRRCTHKELRDLKKKKKKQKKRTDRQR